MPTHHDETLPQRYAREHQEYLKLCGSMTAEQVADLQLQLNNSMAREQALQALLTPADERADLLEGLLREVVALDPRGEFLGWQLDGKIDAALKPAEGGDYDSAHDRAYRNGLMQGYNLALNGSEKEYQDAVARYSGGKNAE